MTEQTIGSLTSLETEFGVMFRRFRRSMAHRARLLDPRLQMTGYQILLSLNVDSGRRATDIVEEFDLDKGAVSRQLSQLEELGLIERTVDPDDRRAQVILLTPSAAQQLAAVRDHRMSQFAARLSNWSPEELRQFAALLTKYNASLES